MEEVRFQPLFFGRYLFTFTLAFLAGDLLYVLIDAKAALFGAIIGAALLLVASFFFSERKKKQLFLFAAAGLAFFLLFLSAQIKKDETVKTLSNTCILQPTREELHLF